MKMIYIFLLANCLFINSKLIADHGPQTSGSGVQTQSAELLKVRRYELSLKIDFTKFDDVSNGKFEEKARSVSGEHQHFDTLNWSYLNTLSLSYGASDITQLGLSMGLYRGDDLEEGHIHSNESFGYHDFGDISGRTDLWATVKHSIYNTDPFKFALYGGIKFPTGEDDKKGDGSSGRLEPSLQPGSGTFDFLLGIACTTHIDDQLKLNSSVQYTIRTQDDHYKIGDSFDAGTGLNYLLKPDFYLFTEANLKYIAKNKENGDRVENSGGTIVYLSIGLKSKITDTAYFSIAPQIPIIQDLNEEQQETDLKVTVMINFDL